MIERDIRGPVEAPESELSAGTEALHLAGLSAADIASMAPVIRAINEVCQQRMLAAEQAGRRRGADLMHETMAFVLSRRWDERRSAEACLAGGAAGQPVLGRLPGFRNIWARLRRWLP